MPQPFSDRLEAWLKHKGSRTTKGLGEAFAEKSFAIIFLLLMSFPALPLPTAGVTHIFEIIVMLLSLELIIGFKTIWLPKRWRTMRLSATTQKKAIPFIISRIRWFERFSQPRLEQVLQHHISARIFGALVFSLTLAAFLAPPFSGLDTLPALGVVIISLSIILGDAVVLAIGLVVGIIGVVIEVGFGELIVRTIHRLLD